MARQYKRDARGRFASGGSSGRRAGGTLAARASLRKSRQKLAAKDAADSSLKGTLSGRAQRAAVTRANKRLQQASRASRVTIAGARGGTLRRPAGYKPRATPAASQAPRNIQGPKLQGVTRARLSGRKMSMGAGLRGKRRQERQQRMAIMDRWMAREGQSPSRAAVAALARKRRAEPLTLGGGTLAARGSLKRSRAKLRENDTPSQRGAVTRANRYAGMAIKRERVSLGQSVKGRYVRGKGRQAGPANSIRPTGGSIRNKGAKNNVVPYKPTSLRGQAKQLQRRTKTLRGRIDRDVKQATDALRSLKSKTRDIKPKLDLYMRRFERENARSIADRRKKNIDGEIARAELDTVGSGPGRKAITRRMNRAVSAASRGSKPAQRAVRVYLDQLAGMGPGKPSRGRNNLRPGPRNTKGAPKRKRKGRGKG